MYIDLYGGHLIPGTLFFLLGIRWLLVTSYLHAKAVLSSWESSSNPASSLEDYDEDSDEFNSDESRPRRRPMCKSSHRHFAYRSKPIMAATCLPCTQIRHEWTESYLKLLGSIIGMVFHIREGVLEYNAATTIPGYANTDTWAYIYRVKHHVAMYMAFFIGAIVELFIHCGLLLPARLDRALLIIEFGVEAFVFANHFHGRNEVDVQLHFLLAVTIIGCLAFTILEAFNERQVLLTYGRILFTFLQGTWFYQLAFTLYHPKYRWDTSDSRLTANVTFHYCIHFFVVVSLMLLCHWATFKIVSNANGSSSKGGDIRRRMKAQRFYGVEYEVCCGNGTSTTDNDNDFPSEKSKFLYNDEMKYH